MCALIKVAPPKAVKTTTKRGKAAMNKALGLDKKIDLKAKATTTGKSFRPSLGDEKGGRVITDGTLNGF